MIDSEPKTLPPLGTLEDSTILSQKQVAAYLNVAYQTLTIWRSTKRYVIPSARVGNRHLYRAGDIKEFIESRMIER